MARIRTERDGGATIKFATHRQSRASPGVTDELPLSLDTILELLQNERRRHVLHYLATTEGETPFRDLVEYVVAQEHEQRAGAVDAAERKSVYVSLYQYHVPKLAEADVLTYNGTSTPIRKARHFEGLLAYLTAIEDVQNPV